METTDELPALAASTQDNNKERREGAQNGSIVSKIAPSTQAKDQPEYPIGCSKPDRLSRFWEHQLTTYLVVGSL